MFCCDEYRKAWVDGEIVMLDNTLYYQEIYVITRCPFCGKKYNR